MASHLMMDIETLNTNYDSVILSIGLAKFNPFGHGVIDVLELKPTIEDQTTIYHRTIDDNTLAWWSKQPQEVIDSTFDDAGRMPFADCMEVLYHYAWNQKRIWANGTVFDISIVEHAFRQTLTDRPQPVPWPFYDVRDTRTVYEMTNVSLKDKKYGSKTTHNAVEDTIHQVIVLQDSYRKLIRAGILSEDQL